MVALVVVALGAAGSPEPRCPGDPASVQQVTSVATGIIEADNARALDRVLALYAPDATLLPPGESPVAGKEAIRPRYESLFAAFTPEIVSRVDEVCVSGFLAYVRGHNRGRLVARGGGPDRVLDDPYLMVLRRQGDGSWRISRLMWHRGAGAVATTGANASWERLKSLVGDWVGTHEGKAARVSYKLVSGGTALQENLEVDADYSRMLTIYHPDGVSVLMTHYCDMGNQPRMRAAEIREGRLDFTYLDATNLKSADDNVMSRLVMTFPADGRLVQEWTSKEGGREQIGRFEFTRKK